MKKLFTTLSLALLMATSFASVKKDSPVFNTTKEFYTVYVQVSNVYSIGTDSEKKFETENRKSIVSKWNKEGYTFSKVQRFNRSEVFGNGLFIVMVKARK